MLMKNFDESQYEDSGMGTFDGVTMHCGGSHLQGDATQSGTTGEVAQTTARGTLPLIIVNVNGVQFKMPEGYNGLEEISTGDTDLLRTV
jgi:hypothetical protein